MLDKSLQELQERMFALPMYSDQFLGIICSIVNNYKETCQGAYKCKNLFFYPPVKFILY